MVLMQGLSCAEMGARKDLFSPTFSKTSNKETDLNKVAVSCSMQPDHI